MVLAITDTNFDDMTGEGLSLIDFWAPWCGPCRMQSPVIEELDETMAGDVNFFKLNVDEEPKTAESFGIMSIPTLLIKKDGEIVEKLVGYHDRTRLEKVLNRYL